MPGLDRVTLDQINTEAVIENIASDIPSDFILAPQYNLIFRNSGERLADQAVRDLRSGVYTPDLPITMSVPKEHFFTRPGSILRPADRFVYEALITLLGERIEDNIDRQRAFSNMRHDDDYFSTDYQSPWEHFQSATRTIAGEKAFLLKADISNYFERLPQHHLINLLSAIDCPPSAVRLLEELLLAFRERNSFGIVQGVSPSDILGNFFLSDLDSYCELSENPSARYVDDIYIGFDSEFDARQGLERLIQRLRASGLHLNESKSRIMPAEDAIREEGAIDALFDAVREEIGEIDTGEIRSPYGFNVDWEVADDESDTLEALDFESAALERFMSQINEFPNYVDRIEKFCLPLLGARTSDSAVDHVFANFARKPHQTRLYCSYLKRFVRSNRFVVEVILALLRAGQISQYQNMYLLGTLLSAEELEREAVNTIIQRFSDRGLAQEVRAIAAIVAMKFGVAVQKRAIRTAYEAEPSEFVKSAILYGARYLTAADKATCKRAWGGHNSINSMIAEAI